MFMICLSQRKLGVLLASFAVMLMYGCKPANPVQVPYSQDVYLSREGHFAAETFRYRIFLPESRTAGEKLPVMLYLHGAGNRGDDNESQLNGLADQIAANSKKIKFIVVIPQCPADRFWDKDILERANKALDDTVVEFNGDKDRLYAVGFSLGGYGVWSIAAMFPGKFAALAPMSGRILPRPNEMKAVSPAVAELEKASEPYKAFAERIGSTPTWIFHGGDDRVVPLDNSRQMFAAMQAAGNQSVKYDEVPGIGHEPLAFRTDGFFDWLEIQRLDQK